MLLPKIPCSFDSTVNNVLQLKNTRDKERICSGFGGWVTTPRKRKSKSKDSICSPSKAKVDRNGLKLTHKSNNQTYYKRYRVDPLEGTFKHYSNHAQYIKLYRETTTLCYKQRTLQELSSMYSAALDINSRRLKQKLQRMTLDGEFSSSISLPEMAPLPKIGVVEGCSWSVGGVQSEKGHTLSGCYNLDLENCSKWDLGQPVEYAGRPELLYVKENQQIPPISTSRAECAGPLMLLPTAPSIPTRLNNQGCSHIAQAAFMCNAYLNKNTVCPVHRLIHRRDTVLHNRCRNHVINNAMEHIKVELPGIPKRSSQKEKVVDLGGPPNSKGSTPRTPDEEEDSSEVRLNNLLSSSNPASPSERISKALSPNKRLVPSMHLPVTALLQYTPNGLPHPATKTVKMKKPLRSKLGAQKSNMNKQQMDPVKPKPDVKQVSYEQQYEKFFTDVLESKGKSSQKKHFQSLSSNKQ